MSSLGISSSATASANRFTFGLASALERAMGDKPAPSSLEQLRESLGLEEKKA